jgi:hypothetical protein
MIRSPSFSQTGSTLVVTLATLLVLSSMAALAITRVMPRLRMAYQNAAWQEARLAAEAGVDAAMADLLVNATGPTEGAWPGWKMLTEDGRISPVQPGRGPGSLLGNTLGLVTGLLSGLLGGGGGGGATPPPNSVTVSAPIFLDNLRISANAAIPTEVDVQLWGLQPAASPRTCWFRIRSMATCALPPSATGSPANLDAPLRRLSLRTVRAGVKKNDVGEPMSIPLPHVSRTVEVLVEPILPFELAIWTARSLSLGTTGTWGVDSYDSRDSAKSAPGGLYPGRTGPEVQENGHVATNGGRTPPSRYGILIAANGARVRGTVATNGGDDPHTAEHENVSGGMALNAAKVRDDFCREMRPVVRPPSGSALQPPPSRIFATGPEDEPKCYLVPGDLVDFRVRGSGTSGRRVVIIMVNGSVRLTRPLIVPPNVTVQLYVRRDIEISANANAGPWNSNRASQLQIYGEPSPGAPATLDVDGNVTVCAAFYGPSHQVVLGGEVAWSGALVSSTFQVIGGGSGGVHYDEALAVVGPPVSYRIARYVEDVRE